MAFSEVFNRLPSERVRVLKPVPEEAVALWLSGLISDSEQRLAVIGTH